MLGNCTPRYVAWSVGWMVGWSVGWSSFYSFGFFELSEHTAPAQMFWWPLLPPTCTRLGCQALFHVLLHIIYSTRSVSTLCFNPTKPYQCNKIVNFSLYSFSTLTLWAKFEILFLHWSRLLTVVRCSIKVMEYPPNAGKGSIAYVEFQPR